MILTHRRLLAIGYVSIVPYRDGSISQRYDESTKNVNDDVTAVNESSLTTSFQWEDATFADSLGSTTCRSSTRHRI